MNANPSNPKPVSPAQPRGLCSPKSISLMELLRDDRRIVKAHEQAVADTLAAVEHIAAKRPANHNL